MNFDQTARKLNILLSSTILLLLLLPLSVIWVQEARFGEKEHSDLKEMEMKVEETKERLGKCGKEWEEREKLVVEVVEEVEERRRRNMDIDLALEECKEDLANMTKSAVVSLTVSRS